MPELDEAKKTSEDRKIPVADEANQKDGHPCYQGCYPGRYC